MSVEVKRGGRRRDWTPPEGALVTTLSSAHSGYSDGRARTTAA
jgi:hypothetical protein